MKTVESGRADAGLPRGPARYLVDRGLLSARDLLDQRLTAFDRSSRHTNWAIQSTHASLFLKSAVDLSDADALGREAHLIEWLRTHHSALRAYLPELRIADGAAGIAVYELVAPAPRAVSSRWLQRGPTRARAAELGGALGTLHRESAPEFPWLAHDQPWPLWIDAPQVDTLETMSAGFFALVRAIQADANLCGSMVSIRSGWQSSAIVHGDLKWENLLPARGRPQPSLVIVDWEAAHIGDPAWDVGGIFASWLVAWLFREPGALQQSESALAALRRAWDPLRAFWRNYRAARELDADTAEVEVSRSMSFAAVRLLQFAAEQVQFSASLTPHSGALVKLASNIAARPREAAAHLAGIALQQA